MGARSCDSDADVAKTKSHPVFAACPSQSVHPLVAIGIDAAGRRLIPISGVSGFRPFMRPEQKGMRNGPRPKPQLPPQL
jgi:hypothetical protein